MSVQDIDAGQRWATELFSQLDNQSIGIICVTKANQAEPWLNFEAGVLAKQLKGDNLNESRVCPLLIDLDANDVTGPLKLLQMMPLNEDGMFRVSQMVNDHAILAGLSSDVLKRTFDKWWPDLKEELDRIVVLDERDKEPRKPVEILEEILGIVRSVDKAVNRSADLFSTRNVGDLSVHPASLVAHPPSSGLETTTLETLRKMFVADSEALSFQVKMRLISAANKLDLGLSEALENGSFTVFDKTVTVDFPPSHRSSFQAVRDSQHREEGCASFFCEAGLRR
jgi:hypothetical protein